MSQKHVVLEAAAEETDRPGGPVVLHAGRLLRLRAVPSGSLRPHQGHVRHEHRRDGSREVGLSRKFVVRR